MSGMEMSEKITKEMISAGIRACRETPPLSDAILVQNIYAAMRAAQPSPAGQGDSPLRVFSAGRWTYDGTGQSFSHEDMDAAAFVVYRDAALASRQPVGQVPVAFRIVYPDGSHSHNWTTGIGSWPSTVGAMGLRFEYAFAAPPAQAVDLGQFRDLIGFAALAAINLPETDPRRDFIRQANEFVKLIDGKAVQP